MWPERAKTPGAMPPHHSLLLRLLFLLLHLPATATATAISTTARTTYRRISWGSNLTLLGSASLMPGAAAVSLTRPSPDGIGAGRALYSLPVRFLLPFSPTVPASFSTRFTFRITPSPTFGDGIAFLLSSSPSFLGSSNGFLGLFPSSSTSDEEDPSKVSTVAVEFDTHRDVALQDADGNHVAVDVASIFSLASAGAGVDLKAAVPITAWVEYRAPRCRLRVWLSYSSSRRPEKPTLATNVDLSGLLREYMYLGFSASNGHGAALHIVERWTFRTFGFSNSSYTRNTPSPKNSQPLPRTHRHFSSALAGTLAGLIFLVLVVIASACLFASRTCRSRTIQKPAVRDERGDKAPGMFSMEVIRVATRGFDSGSIIGNGGSGATVYEGMLASGSRVAVKRFEAVEPCTQAFATELAAVLGCQRHRNLVPLAGWCCDKGELALVYEFMPNGNLDQVLHAPGGATLQWDARFGTVLGIASALAFLHDECERQVVHRDVKSSNVLLDAGFNARLGDFGLARLVSHGGMPLATQPAGTLGYLAPEYVHSGVATERSDVYSFGVLVLEVATGRRPTEKGISVVDWVWVLWGRGRLVDAADRRLEGRFDADEMRRVLLVGLSCAHPDCRRRPGMRRVVRMLEGAAPLLPVPEKKPPVVLQSPLQQGSSMNSGDTVNTAFYSCR